MSVRLNYFLDVLLVPLAVLICVLVICTYVPGAPFSKYRESEHLFPDVVYKCENCSFESNISVMKEVPQGDVGLLYCSKCGAYMGWERIWNL